MQSVRDLPIRSIPAATTDEPRRAPRAVAAAASAVEAGGVLALVVAGAAVSGALTLGGALGVTATLDSVGADGTALGGAPALTGGGTVGIAAAGLAGAGGSSAHTAVTNKQLIR